MKRKRKWIFGLILVFAVTASSCQGMEPLGDWLSSRLSPSNPAASGTASLQSAVDQPSSFSVERAEAPELPAFEYREQRGDFHTLSEAGRELYSRLLDSFYQISSEENKKGLYETASVSVRDLALEEGDLEKALLAVQNDNPQVFWLSGSYEITSGLSEETVRFYSVLSPEQCNQSIALLNQSTQEILAGMPEGLNEFEREEYLVFALSARCEYDVQAAEAGSGKSWEAYTAYGALCGGSAVCEGYARAMQLLSSYVDLSCRLVSGWGKTERHLWNLIQIDGLWYHLDPTWVDGDSGLLYEYFNLTDDQIRESHTIDLQVEDKAGVQLDFNLPLPACTSDAANYYKRRGIPVNGLDDAETVGKAMALFVEAGQTSVPLYVAEDSDYEETMERVFGDQSGQIFAYIRKANDFQDAAFLDPMQVQFFKAPVCRGATVLLNTQ